MSQFARELCHGIVMSGLSTKEVAGKVGIGAAHLGAIKRGECRPPKASTVRDLCRVLKLPPVAMLSFAHIEKRPKGVTAAMLCHYAAETANAASVKVGS